MAGLPTFPFFFGVIATTHLPFAGILIVHVALPALTRHEPRTVFAALADVVALIEYVVCGAAVKLAVAGLPVSAADKYPASLSGGRIKRAALARALALDPDILFLDEPTAGLDPIGAAAFDQLILTLRDALGLSVFLVTHDLDTLYTITDRVAVLAQKKVLVADAIDKVSETDDAWIHEYFHGPRGRAALVAAQQLNEV